MAMNEKQKLVEEIAERINSMRERNAYYYLRENGELVTHEAFADSYAIAAELAKYYQPRLPKGSVVLTEEEYTNYMVDYMGVREIKDRVSKDTARKILKWILETFGESWAKIDEVYDICDYISKQHEVDLCE